MGCKIVWVVLGRESSLAIGARGDCCRTGLWPRGLDHAVPFREPPGVVVVVVVLDVMGGGEEGAVVEGRVAGKRDVPRDWPRFVSCVVDGRDEFKSLVAVCGVEVGVGAFILLRKDERRCVGVSCAPRPVAESCRPDCGRALLRSIRYYIGYLTSD